MAKKYQDSPFGEADYPHLNKPDAKFNADNPLWKTGLKLADAEAQKFREAIDAEAQAAFNEYMENGEGSKLTPGERKKWDVYKPYSVVEDEDGNPTDDVVFEFKQNSRIKTAEGVKHIQIALYDASGKELPRDPDTKLVKKLIRGGSTIRVRYGFRVIVMKSQKLVGVRLDFSMVQVQKFATGNGGAGFGAVEGDTVDDDEGGFGSSGGNTSAPDDGSADY